MCITPVYLAFLHGLRGWKSADIFHTVIDESQDYSLLQLHIVKYLFPKSSFTLLGDICQTVNSVTTIQRYEDYGQVFGDDLVRIRLSRCYRSSSQINGLAFRLIGEANRPEGYSYFDRPVKKPRYVICRDMFSCLAQIGRASCRERVYVLV